MKKQKAEEMAEESTNDTDSEGKKSEEVSMMILYVFECY